MEAALGFPTEVSWKSLGANSSLCANSTDTSVLLPAQRGSPGIARRSPSEVTCAVCRVGLHLVCVGCPCFEPAAPQPGGEGALSLCWEPRDIPKAGGLTTCTLHLNGAASSGSARVGHGRAHKSITATSPVEMISGPFFRCNSFSP